MNYLFYLYNVIALEIVFKDQLLLDLYSGKRTNDQLFKSNPLLVRKFQKTIIKISAIESFNLISQNRGLNYEKLKGLTTSNFALLLLTSYLAFHAWCFWYLQAGGSISDSYLRILQPLAESLFGLVLILLSQISFNRTINSLLRPVAFVGAISYPLYLTHLIVLDGVKRYSMGNPESILQASVGLQSLVIVVGSLILAWLIHEAIEKPGMKLGRTSK